MARRFKRDNFLFPYNLEQQRPDIAARPVDAFTRADEGSVIQAPQRPFEVNRPDQDNRLLSLARTLGTVQQQVDNIGEKQFKDFTQRAESAGSLLAEQQAGRQSFRQLISQTRQTEGEEAARDVMRMNPYVARGYDQTRARTASLSYNAELQSRFSLNPVIDEETGERLHDIETSDPRYQGFLQSFRQEFDAKYNMGALDPMAAANVLPAIQDTNQRVTIAQQELRGQRRLQAYADATAELAQTLAYDLGSNVEFIDGSDPNAAQDMASALGEQLDEAAALGFGGSDLDGVYGMVINSIAAAAITTGNAELLRVAEMIEIGPEGQRQLLMNTARGIEFAPMLQRAAEQIEQKERADWRYGNEVEDRERDESMKVSYTNLSRVSALYAIDPSPANRQLLDETVASARADATEFNYLSELNATIQTIVQDSADTVSVTAANPEAMAILQAKIESGQLSGLAAQREVAELYTSGQLGGTAAGALNLNRFYGLINSKTDQATGTFSNALSESSATVRQAIEERLGFTRDENDQLVGFKTILRANGLSDADIRNLQGWNQSQLQDWLRTKALAVQAGTDIPYSQAMIEAMNQVVNGDLDVFTMSENPDPQDVINQVNEYENLAWAANEQFKQREGRDMQPQELAAYLRNHETSFLSGQRTTLPSSNPASRASVPAATTAAQAIGGSLAGLADSTANPRTTTILTKPQLTAILRYNMETEGGWPPEVVALAAANGMTPGDFYQVQSGRHGVTLDQDILNSIGVQVIPQAGAGPGAGLVQGGQPRQSSSYAPDYSSSYQPVPFEISRRGDKDLERANHVDNFDITLSQNGSDAVNIPAPYNGTITRTGYEEGGWGYYIEIQAPTSGNKILIAHMAGPAYLKEGQRVRAGAPLGKQGSTGSSSGPHIHLEIRNRAGVELPRAQGMPIVDAWMNMIQQGAFLAPGARGGGGILPASPGSGGGGRRLESRATNPDIRVRANLIRDTAGRLGVPPDELAAVLFRESGLEPTAKGGTNNEYQGLAQFGISERAMYGVDRWSTSQEQLAALERFLKDRGYTPGMGIGRLYATILGGNPSRYDVSDGNGSPRQVEPDLKAGGSFNNTARQILGW